MHDGVCLPLEVILLVLDRFVDSDAISATRKRDLGRNVALVCRSLRAVGTSMVWADVSQTIGKDEARLKALLENPGVAAHVRNLAISTSRGSTLSPADFARLPLELRGLRHLELHGLPAVVLDHLFTSSPTDLRSCCDDLYCCDTRTLPHDRIYNPFKSMLTSLNISQANAKWSDPKQVLNLASKIKTLKSLELNLNLPRVGFNGIRDRSGTRSRLAEDEDVEALSKLQLEPIALENLTVSLSGGSSRYNTAVLRTLLTRLVLPDQLRTLRLHHPAGSAEESWLPTFPLLEVFHLELPSRTFQNFLPTIACTLPLMTQLDAAILRVITTEPGCRKTATAPSKVLGRFLKSLPPFLTQLELAITFPGGPEAGPLHSFLADRRHMKLREMAVTVRLTDSEGGEYRGVNWIRKQVTCEDGLVRWQVSKEGSVEYTYV